MEGVSNTIAMLSNSSRGVTFSEKAYSGIVDKSHNGYFLFPQWLYFHAVLPTQPVMDTSATMRENEELYFADSWLIICVIFNPTQFISFWN